MENYNPFSYHAFMTILFISDLHLDETRPNITHIFLDFLNFQASKASALYILGDFFEVWVGDDDETEFHTQISHALKTLSNKGIPIYLMHGNRDFLLGQQFAEKSGCEFICDPVTIHLNDKVILLMHGDSLCTHDIPYQRFRRIVRNKFYQKIFFSFPLKMRKFIAQKLRKTSQKRSYELSYITDVNLEEVKKMMKRYQAQYLIHGHTHQPGFEFFQIDNELNTRIVLSDWEERGNALVFEEDQFKLMYFD